MSTPQLTEIASGLLFPEGPVAMADGSVLVVEMVGQSITRVNTDGSLERLVHVPGGPNGLAAGPDGKFFLCNNGGSFKRVEKNGKVYAGEFDAAAYRGGKVQRIDIHTGEIVDLYTECDGRPLRAPNDLVFDAFGGFYFTDHGLRQERSQDRTGIYYAKADGSHIREIVFPSEAPNGIGLSPDGNRLYWAETHTGRVFARDIVEPGVLAPTKGGPLSPCICGLPGVQLLDSLAIDSAGNICVGTLINGGITVISPSGEVLDHVKTDDSFTTNICFGGPDLMTAYLTLSTTGRLVSVPWPRKGLKLHHG